ncbi:Nrap protein [Abeliophyllum distichum]|uniref:Nrap protein n=1 Tax=Abeliophyllum distichum TaxID=126358 RepID=A0ABD1SAP6_9LAMI
MMWFLSSLFPLLWKVEKVLTVVFGSETWFPILATMIAECFSIVFSVFVWKVLRVSSSLSMLSLRSASMKKDYLNYRYHAKRFLYLCIIKKYLKFSSLIQEVRWSTFHNEACKPLLVVYPAARLSGNAAFFVKIIPTSTSLFCASKLILERNNVRSLNQEGVLQATLKYSSSILEDTFLEDNFEFVKRIFMEWKELGEALILFGLGKEVRYMLMSHDCLSGFLISIIMAYLASKSGKNRINEPMNVIQILCITLDFIANSKIWDHGLYFQPDGESNISNKDRRTQFQSFPVIICDSFGFNLAFRMSLSGFQELRDEASLALSCIDKCKDGGFDEMFMTKFDFPAKYNYCVRLNLKGSREVYSCGFCLDEECWRTYEQKVLSIIDQALRGRTKLVRVIWSNATFECNIEDGLSMLDGEALLIGISISSMEEAFKQAVMGPSPEEKDKALEFQKFWRDKATLRWFRDGKIAEVAVWEHKESERHIIIKAIIEHVLSHHLSLPKENIISIVDQLDFSLLHGNKATDPISFSVNLLKAFDNLSKHLRLLDDIPLRISSVQPLDSAFRLTSVFPPPPHPLAYEDSVGVKPQNLTSTCIRPLEVMIQLEGSGNWLMDDLAMEKTKSAFLMKIGESLQEKWGVSCTATEDDVDVFMSGYAFRLKFLHERSLGLVQRQGLQNEWVSAHLFSNSLTEEAIELLVAYLFLKPLPFRPPSSRITGFLRFLRLLSEYDWSFSALIADINGDLTPEDDKEINHNFMSNKKEYKDNMRNISPAMFVATVYDKASEAWTSVSPTAAELRRLATYAASSAKFLTSVIMQNLNDSYIWECLFCTPLNNYNAVILLDRDKLPFPQHLLFLSKINQGRQILRVPSKIFQPFLLPGDLKGSLEEMKNKLMVNFDPLRYFIHDIEREFHEKFKMWYDSLGGDAIGLTFGNKSSKKRGRNNNCEDKHLVDSLRAVGELGKGFVRNIYLLKVPKVNS